MFVKVRYSLLAAVIWCNNISAQPLPNTVTTDHLVARLTEALGRLKQSANVFQCDCTMKTYRDTGSGEETIASLVEKRRSRPGGWALITSTSSDPPKGNRQRQDRVLAINPYYDFRLQASKPGEWSLANFSLLNNREPSDEQRRLRDDVASSVLYDAHYRSGNGVYWSQLLANPSMKITSAIISPEHPSCYRVSYSGSSDNFISGVKLPLTFRGWADFCPTLDWATVRVSETTVLPKGEATTSHTFLLRQYNGITVVDNHEHVTSSRVANRATRTRIIYAFSSWIDANADTTEFHLKHYGLPEPVEVKSSSNAIGTYIWFLIASFAFAVFAIVARRLAKRCPRPTAPGSGRRRVTA